MNTTKIYFKNSRGKWGSKYYNGHTMNCGDWIKSKKKLKIETSKEKRDILYQVIREFKPKSIRRLGDNNLYIDTTGQAIRFTQLIFKICRYQRNTNLKAVLYETMKLVKIGVPIYKAFPISHHYCQKLTYYSATMDGTHTNMVYIGNYKTLKDFHTLLGKKRTVNSIFLYDSKISKTTIQKLFEEKNYKQIKDLIN